MLTEESGEASADALIRQIQEIDRQALKLASEIDEATHAKVVKSLEKNVLGGSALQLLFARRKIKPVEDLGLSGKSGARPETESDITSSTMMFMASNIAKGRLDKREATQKLSDLLIGQKSQLLKQLRRELQIKAFMDAWLYAHVPLSFALLAALIAHVFSVFFDW